MSTAVAADVVPPLGPPPRPRRPRTVERTLPNGLHVVVVRAPSVPLVEIRLRVPFAGPARSGSTYPARATVLADTMLSGTARRSQTEIAETLQGLGADLGVVSDADRLLVSGSSVAPNLPEMLDLIAELVTEASYPAPEVAIERDRLVERLTMARAQPSVIAREALSARLFGSHPYALELPEIDAVRDVGAAQLRRMHTERVVPAGSILVLVGDLSPARALDRVERALSCWETDGGGRFAPPLPDIVPGPPLLVDRPGSVQSSIRIGAPARHRADPGYPAYQLANMVFGGYFSSRLTENIREDKGYTYSPASRIDHAPAGSTLVVQADVATEVTAPALLEIGYELGRMATGRITRTELDDVRQYVIGTLALSIATQSGLANTLSALAGVHLGIDWLREHPVRISKVTVDEAVEQAAELLAPGRTATVVVGDAGQMSDEVARLGPVDVST